MNNLKNFINTVVQFTFLTILLLGSVFTFGQEQNAVLKPFYIYDDEFRNGPNSGTMGSNNGSSLTLNAKCTENPFKGEYCYKMSADGTEGWCGNFVQQHGDFDVNLAEGTVCHDISEYRWLTFYARTDEPFLMGRLGYGQIPNDVLQYEGKVQINKEWTRYAIELGPETVEHRKNINSIFLAVFEGKGTIYLDEIYFADQFLENNLNPDKDVIYSGRKEPLDPEAFYLYSDKWNHGIPSGYMGEKNGSSMKFDWSYRENPAMGPKCMKISVDKTELWRGLHVQITGKWNIYLTPDDEEDKVDLSEYDQLIFSARTDGETVVVPEIGMGYGDLGEERRFLPYIEIGPKWKEYVVDLRDTEMSKHNTVFYMLLPKGTFYLDEVRYVKDKNKKRKKLKGIITHEQ